MPPATHPPSALLILDGFGYNANQEGNAIYAARTPHLDWLWSNFPHTLVKAAEEVVGLSFGQIGNSEVGHLAIGTGRVIQSPLQRIDAAMKDRSFFSNKGFRAATDHVKKQKSRLHLIGMISTAGVHADVRHLAALLEFAKQEQVSDVFIHAILDGRDTGPKEAMFYLQILEKDMKRIGVGTIATIGGRAYAMDRNNNWSQTERYYAALAGLAAPREADAIAALQKYYAQNLDDETIPPTIIVPEGKISDGDAVIITNFREDRVRQLAHCLADATFSSFPRNNYPRQLLVVTMTEYEKGLAATFAFRTEPVKATLSDMLEQYGWRQLHISETEKYAHVTYFFNGGREEQLPHESHVNIPSDTPDTFLGHPQMQAEKIAAYIVSDLSEHAHDFYVANFANPDMIGHTGHWQKTIEAIEAVDMAVGQIATAIFHEQGYLFVTADHGNAELKIDLLTKNSSKDHTISPVPFIVAGERLQKAGNPQRITFGASVTGILQDVAPTILSTLKLPVPPEMTGAPLFSV